MGGIDICTAYQQRFCHSPKQTKPPAMNAEALAKTLWSRARICLLGQTGWRISWRRKEEWEERQGREQGTWGASAKSKGGLTLNTVLRREGIELVTIRLFIALQLQRVHLVFNRLFEAKDATKRKQCQKRLLVFNESGYNLERVLSSKNHFVARQAERNHLGAVRDRNYLSLT